jgi:hypothetical protein
VLPDTKRRFPCLRISSASIADGIYLVCSVFVRPTVKHVDAIAVVLASYATWSSWRPRSLRALAARSQSARCS